MFSYFSLDLISHFMLFAVVHYLCYFFSCHHKSYFWHKNNDGSLMKNTWSTECLRTIQFLYIKIYTDPTRLERCLRNLLENALKYSDDDVKITVVLSEHDNHLSIAIQDTGWEYRKSTEKLGKQFYRVQIEGKSSSRPWSGTLQCETVSKRNGRIGYVPEYGRIRFHFYYNFTLKAPAPLFFG